jgi:exodeoxyribonuclease VII large subunit
VISAVGHETDFTICDFVADLRAPTPSAAAELAVPDARTLADTLCATGDRLAALMRTKITESRARVARLAEAGALSSPRYYLEEKRMTVSFLERALFAAAERRVTASRNRFTALCAKLETLDPLRVLTRGYAAVFDTDNTPVTRAEGLSGGDQLYIRFADKTASVTVNDVRESEKINGR